VSIRQRTWPRSFWYSVGLYVVFNSLFLALVIIKPGTYKQFVVADDTGQALGWLLGTLFCFIGLDRSWRRSPSHANAVPFTRAMLRWVSVFLALGIFCQFLGQILYTYYDICGWSDFPSWADAGYLSTFPFLLMGILLLPTRPLAGITRSRVVLDGFMIMTALVTFSWYFILGPTILQGNESVFAKIVGSAYPFFDLVLIFCVLRLSFPSSDPALQLVVRLLSLGLIIIVITDTIYDYQTLKDMYTNGLQDVGWPVGYMLIGLAAQALNLARKRQNISTAAGQDEESSHEATIAVSSGWRSFLPYALIPAVILLIVSVWTMGTNASLARGVYIGGAALILLILLRQIFAIRETNFYNEELRRVQQELHSKNEALSAANTQLETQANELAAAYEQQMYLNELKDQFLLNVNHELRTPLTAIHGYLELLHEYQGELDAAKQASFTNYALQACDELQHLVNNVLDTLRSDFQTKAPQLEVFPIVTVVHEVIDLLEPQKLQEHQVTVQIPETLTVRADQQYLHQVLLNLLSNALKYSPEHTLVVVSAQLRTSSTAGASEVCVCVQDAGLGIPPSEIPVLFGKFMRLKRDLSGPVRGTGLGLYICKQLVEAMEGQIWVESSGIAGEGSRFYFTLPSAPPIAVEEQLQTNTNAKLDSVGDLT
jgi:signal transduction histidine kinase